MQKYIGTKLVNSKPMTRIEYNNFRGWLLPEDENGDDAGYLVEYLDGGKANTEQYSGYVSWSPAEQFDNAYRPCDQMTFGLAIEALRLGKKVARAGWNGKGMWLVLVNGTESVTLRDGTPYKNATGLDECQILSHIDMWTTDSTGRRAMLPGWLASQTDMLSQDWVIVD